MRSSKRSIADELARRSVVLTRVREVTGLVSRLLSTPRMTKIFLALALFAAPAFADPNPTYQVGFKVDGGKDQRHYTVKLVDKACGSAFSYKDEAKNETRDDIKVCAHNDNGGVRLEIEWKLRDKDREISNTSALVLARGATQEIDGGTAKLSVALI